jgi:hypothetical protein
MDESLAESIREFDSELNMVEFPYQGDLFENGSCRMETALEEKFLRTAGSTKWKGQLKLLGNL